MSQMRLNPLNGRWVTIVAERAQRPSDFAPRVNGVEDDPTRVETDSVELAIVRVLDGTGQQTGARLTGAWPDGSAAVVLAHLLT